MRLGYWQGQLVLTRCGQRQVTVQTPTDVQEHLPQAVAVSLCTDRARHLAMSRWEMSVLVVVLQQQLPLLPVGKMQRLQSQHQQRLRRRLVSGVFERRKLIVLCLVLKYGATRRRVVESEKVAERLTCLPVKNLWQVAIRVRGRSAAVQGLASIPARRDWEACGPWESTVAQKEVSSAHDLAIAAVVYKLQRISALQQRPRRSSSGCCEVLRRPLVQLLASAICGKPNVTQRKVVRVWHGRVGCFICCSQLKQRLGAMLIPFMPQPLLQVSTVKTGCIMQSTSTDVTEFQPCIQPHCLHQSSGFCIRQLLQVAAAWCPTLHSSCTAIATLKATAPKTVRKRPWAMQRILLGNGWVPDGPWHSPTSQHCTSCGSSRERWCWSAHDGAQHCQKVWFFLHRASPGWRSLLLRCILRNRCKNAGSGSERKSSKSNIHRCIDHRCRSRMPQLMMLL